MAAAASVGSEAEGEVAGSEWLLTMGLCELRDSVAEALTASGTAAFKGCLHIVFI